LHKTVFPITAIECLRVREGAVVVDATFGNGGHAKLIADVIGPSGTLIVFDQDADAITRAEKLREVLPNIQIVQSNFRYLGEQLQEIGHHEVDAILFDIGFSQNQLDESGRGFSFKKDEPLDMRMDPHAELTAATIINTYPEKELADLIYTFGEERRSRRIARNIVKQRDRKPIHTTGELAELLQKMASPKARFGRIHPATRTFQALRIAVNDELECLKEGLAQAHAQLKEGGRCAVISFHSLEDRIVKHLFRDWAKEGMVTVLTKKPLRVSDDERRDNPRSRSAKMRVIEKRIVS